MDWTFRPLTREDFDLLGSWLADPTVARWWAHDPSPAAVERDFGPAIDGQEPTYRFVALCDGEPVGMVQRYRWHDHAGAIDQMAGQWEPPPEAASMDYLLGGTAHIGRGLGRRVLAAFVDQLWVDWPSAPVIAVVISTANEASWRCLGHVGFELFTDLDVEPDNPIDDRRHKLMGLWRPGTAARLA